MPVDYEALATGKYYEDLDVGLVIRHPITRTVTETDNLLFSTLTHNVAWLHLDDEYCKTTEYGQRLVNSNFTLSLASGLTVIDTTLGTTLGNLGYNDVKFPKPVFFGDTLHVVSEVITRRESKSNPKAGIVEFETRAYNQRDEMVVSFRRIGLMKKRSPQTAS
jgi:acyl dehydratase